MTQPVVPLEWDSGFDEATVALAYEASTDLPRLFSDWADALDNKVVATFGVASALVTLVPTFATIERRFVPNLFLGLAISFWVFAVVACYLAYRPVGIRIEPNPKTLLAPRWLTKKPMHFYYDRMRWLGKTFDENKATLERKANRLAAAMAFASIEVLWLALALVLGRPRP